MRPRHGFRFSPQRNIWPISLFRITTVRFRPRSRTERKTKRRSLSESSRIFFLPIFGSTSLLKVRVNSALPSCRATPSFNHSAKRSATVRLSVVWRSASAMVAAMAAWTSIFAALFALVGSMPLATFVLATSRSARNSARDFFGQEPSRWSCFRPSSLNSYRNNTVMPRTPARTFPTIPPSSRSVFPSSASVRDSNCRTVSLAIIYPPHGHIHQSPFLPHFLPHRIGWLSVSLNGRLWTNNTHNSLFNLYFYESLVVF